VPLLFYLIAPRNIGRFHSFWQAKSKRNCSFGHRTLVLSLHYLVKSRCLAVYNNEYAIGYWLLVVRSASAKRTLFFGGKCANFNALYSRNTVKAHTFFLICKMWSWKPPFWGNLAAKLKFCAPIFNSDGVSVKKLQLSVPPRTLLSHGGNTVVISAVYAHHHQANIEQTSSKYEACMKHSLHKANIKQRRANIEQLEHSSVTSCTCILNALAECLLDNCSMFAWSCKQGIKTYISQLSWHRSAFEFLSLIASLVYIAIFKIYWKPIAQSRSRTHISIHFNALYFLSRTCGTTTIS